MKDYPNEKALYNSHRKYLDAMREFIFSYLEKMAPGEAEELIGLALNCQPSDNVMAAIDFGDIPYIFQNYWDDFFKQRFGYNKQRNSEGYDIRSVTRLISKCRNRSWGHPGVGDLDPEFTRACLFLITDVLEEIGKWDAKQAVEDIRDRLFSDEPEEHPAKVENANLKECLAEISDRLAVVETEKAEYEEELKRLKVEKTEYAELLDTVEREKIEIEKQLSETENRLKAIELDSDEHIETLTDKTELEERYETTSIKEWRRKIWKQLCDYAVQRDSPVRFHKPGSDNYLNVSRSLIDCTGFRMNVWLGTDNREIAIRLYMSKQGFYILEKQRKEIEQEFCESLEWEELPQRRESRISLRKDIIDPTDESDWQNQHEWVISKLEKFHRKFNEVFLPRSQELNTSDSLSEDEDDLTEIEEHLPPNTAIPNSVTFQGTTFTKRLNKYRVEGEEITQTFWHYWHSQGREGKQEMRDAGWSVEKINDDWEVAISPEDFQAWIENEVTELSNLLDSSQNEGPSAQPPRSFSGKTVLPTGKEMEQPVLELLADGRERRRVEIINHLTKHFSLTDDERRYLSKTGQAEKHLVKEGLIERTRTRYYKITARGLQVLRQNTADVPF